MMKIKFKTYVWKTTTNQPLFFLIRVEYLLYSNYTGIISTFLFYFDHYIYFANFLNFVCVSFVFYFLLGTLRRRLLLDKRNDGTSPLAFYIWLCYYNLVDIVYS